MQEIKSETECEEMFSADEIVQKIMDIRQEIVGLEQQSFYGTEEIRTQIRELEERIADITAPLNETITELRAEEQMLLDYLYEEQGRPEAPVTTEMWELVPKFSQGKKVDIYLANQIAVELKKEGEFMKLVTMTQADCKKFFGEKYSKAILVEKDPVFKGFELDLTEKGLAKRIFGSEE